jgi:hypothetical protein
MEHDKPTTGKKRFSSVGMPKLLSSSRISSYIPKLLIPIILIAITGFYLFQSQVNQPVKVDVAAYKHLYNIAASGKKQKFVTEWLKSEIDGPYDVEPLKELCSSPERKYQPGLIVKCDHPWGGFGNVKNIMLNCIRFAIEGGG